MKQENREQLARLAVAIAAGQAVSAWAQANRVPKRTAYRWSRDPEVRRLVAEVRRRSIDRAIGRLSKHATAAAEEIARLATKAESEAIKLQACRAVLADLMAVTDYQAFDERLSAVERTISHEPR